MIEGLPIMGLTAPTLLGVVILMLFTGKLWTASAYNEKKEEAERWKTAYEKEQEARAASDKQTTELLELARTTNAFITAVFSNSEKIRQAGGTDVAPPSH